MLPRMTGDELFLALLVFSAALLVAGFAWIRLTTRFEGGGRSPWRHQRRTHHANPFVSSRRDLPIERVATKDQDPTRRIESAFAKSWRRARRGRSVARLAFAATVSLVVTLLVDMSPGLSYSIGQEGLRGLSRVLGIGGVVVGLVWMIRILRANHDPDAAAWRYRDF